MTDEIDRKTRETAKKLFDGGIKMDPPYLLWKAFDRELAKEFSRFITGNLYSHEVLTLPERQMVACAALAALGAHGELKLHVNAALNVGCDPRKLAEALPDRPLRRDARRQRGPGHHPDVLAERGQWPLPD
jgi:4-carboxymuconolactone decarboxylase